MASGHYHTPLIPDIPGLAEAKSQWPVEITHSKSFRNAEGFEGKVNFSEELQTIIATLMSLECPFDWRRCILS